MAGLAGFAHSWLQQGVVEMALLAETFDPGMIAMAGDTLLGDQFLVKCHGGQRLGDGKAGRRQAPDLLWLVARQAAPGICAEERRMAGKAVEFQLLVARNQLARTHHQVGINEYQYRQDNQIGGQQELENSAHAQPQNRKTLTI